MNNNLKLQSRKMMKDINIGIAADNRSAIAEQLSILLANEFVLYTMTRNAHWNVIGIDFLEKHNMFEEQYTALEAVIDEVAEKIRTLGAVAPGSISAFAKLATLEEKEPANHKSKAYIEMLLEGHEHIIRRLRECIEPFSEEYKDEGSTDFLIGLMSSHEKTAWMLRAHLA